MKDQKTFGHYVLLRELGRGAQGIVYLAEDSTIGRKVALKLLSGAMVQSEGARERFHREAQMASRLSHPGICNVHEFGLLNDTPFIAMEYLQGMTLADMIAEAKGDVSIAKTKSASRGSTMSSGGISKDGLQDLLRIFERTAEALHSAHEAGLVHRDIKPANIMVTGAGNPVILDFGLARDTSDDQQHTLTQSGQVMGTPAYMAWEQILGKRDQIDRRTDVYSLGVSLYECLTLSRPYEAEGFDQLYRLILQGAPANPRKKDPRIPRDLDTVVEVAMDRDRNRRYPTAREFARDLRRVRSFEPIQAKAANAWTRFVKWTRRNPTLFVGVAAIVLFGLIGVGAFLQQGMQRRQETEEQLGMAESALAAKDPIQATEALARVRDRDPDSQRAQELSQSLDELRVQLEQQARELEARMSAAEAREEARLLQLEYAEKRAKSERLRIALEADRPRVFGDYSPPNERAAFASREDEMHSTNAEAERLLRQAREALERAARAEAPWGGGEETRTAFVEYYLDRWREATAAGKEDQAAHFRAAVEREDLEGVHQTELYGHGVLTVDITPPDAELFLFRYEPYQSLRPGADVPRLVPVPTTGMDRVRSTEWIEGFAPGDPCLVIERVEAGSPADALGLGAGDLVLGIDDQAAAEGLFCIESPTLEATNLPARVLSLNDSNVRDRLDWNWALESRDGDADQLLLATSDDWVECDARKISTRTAHELLEDGCQAAPMRVTCLRDGEPLLLALEAGEPSGLSCKTTAYPLILSRENRVQAGTSLTMQPGSYLLFARSAGHEALRVPLWLPRLGTLQPTLELETVGAAPPGFLRIPAGVFRSAGDRLATEPAPEQEVFVEEFYISRKELSNEEWFAFLEDPEIAARTRQAGGTLYLPREDGRPMPRQNLGGPDTPVMGISLDDLQDYLLWRNALAEESGEPWEYDLPSEMEWEKATRGTDGRTFAWGWRFDYAATHGRFSRKTPVFDAPSEVEPRDESPYGLMNTMGQRSEWTRDWFQMGPDQPVLFNTRGGSWRSEREDDFRAASRHYAAAQETSAMIGARLIARRRE